VEETELALPTATRPHLVLVRHGETEWSKSGRHTGASDVPLTDAGREQARKVGELFGDRRFGLALTSPRQRARDTAALAGHPDAEVDDRLVEWDYGDYEGLTTPEISEQLGRPWLLWSDGVPGGESLAEVAERCRGVLDRVAPTLEAGEDVLIVAHSHLLRVLAATWLGEPALGRSLYLGTGSVVVLGREHGTPAIVKWNLVPR
jgi:probable phosphoglycerate mutase